MILYGQVICLNVKSTTYMKGHEPQSPSSEANKNAEAFAKTAAEDLDKRTTKIYHENFVIVEEEFKVVEFGVGTMIGELAMMDPTATRALSGMAKTDCIFLLLNRDAFDILVKVRMTIFNLVGTVKERDRSFDSVYL